MKNIPTITINNPNKPININVINTGVTGNQFVDWSGSNNQFIQSSSNNNLGNFNIPNINVPNINSSGSGGGSGLTTPFTQYVSKTPSYTAQEMVGWLESVNSTQDLKFNLPYKEINLSGKSVTNEDMVFFAQRMSNFAFHLDSLQLNHNPIGDYGIQALFNCAFTVPLGRSVVHLKLNNCNFGDVGAELIAAYVRDGYMPATRVIDVSGNNITEVGQGCFVEALESPSTQDIAITLEVHANKSGVINFIKKAASYIFEQHSKAQAFSKATEIALYGDFAYCKKVLKDASFDVATGLIKESLNPIQRLKATKKITAVGIFAMVAKEGAGDFLSEDMAHCFAAINAKLGVGIVGLDTAVSGDIIHIDDIL